MVVEHKMKQTEIGLIPEDWKLVDLSELSSKIASGKSNTLNNDNGIYPIYGSTGIIGKKKYFDYEGAKITVARVGANAGYISIIDGKYCISDNTLFVQSNDKVIINFLYKYLQSINLNKYVFGSGQPLITGTILKNLRIPLPPLPEQQAIAEALSDADAWIASLEQLIAKKRLLKQGAMQELLTPPSHAEPAEAWEVKKLGEIADYRRGSFPQPYGLDKWYDETNGMPFIQVFDVAKNRKLKPDTKWKISELAQPMSVFVPAGTIVLTIQGSIGRIALTQYDAYCDRTLLIFQKIDKKLDEFFFLLSVEQLFEIEKEKAPGGTIKTITKEALSDFDIAFPKSKEEQARIATILSDMDAELEALEAKLAKAQQIKQGMMQELLTGRVRLV